MSKGCLGQLSERAGPNTRERRAGPENVSRGSRPSARKGKATAGGVAAIPPSGSAGVMTRARRKGKGDATRESRYCGRAPGQLGTREGQLGQ